MADVYRFSKIEQVQAALDLLGVRDFAGTSVPVKLHMGEPGNEFYVSPSLVRLMIQPGRSSRVATSPGKIAS